MKDVILQKTSDKALKMTSTLVSKMGCYFFWGEPKLPESVRKYYSDKESEKIAR